MRTILSTICLVSLLTVGKDARANGSVLRMALVSSKSDIGDLRDNLTNHLNWIDKAVAQGAEFVGFPECSLTGYKFGPGYGIPLDAPEIQSIINKAIEKGIYISVGVAEATNNTWYNTHVLAGPNGVVGIMHKVSLIDNSAGEADYCTAGTEYPHFNVKGIPLGIAICADATYFDPVDHLAANGAQAIFVPHASYLQSTPQSWIDWRTQNGYPWPIYANVLDVYLIGCNNAGLYNPPRAGEQNMQFASGALVVGPDGSTLAKSSITNNIETMILFDLPVPGSLSITRQPAGRVVSEGSEVAFRVQVSGAEPVTCQWYVGNSAIEGATNQTLVLTNVQASVAGTYTASVSNPNGSLTSNPALLFVQSSGHTNALRMALVSSKSDIGDLRDNLTNHLNWIDKAVAQGAEFVGFPECSLTGYKFGPGYGIPLDAPEIQSIVNKAIEKGIYISVGVAEATNNTWYNTHVLAGPNGVVGIMHKVSLINNSAGESQYCTAGTEYPHFNVKGIPLGIAICADATYFDPVDHLAANGAQAIFVPHASYLQSTPQSWIDWRTQNGYPWPIYANVLDVYLIGCNNAGLYNPPRAGEQNMQFASGALVVGPDGSTLAKSSITNNIETMILFDLPVPDAPTPPQSPVFTNQPVSITVLEGDTATFTGQATGDEPLTYQWYVGNSAIEGATNQTLVLTNVQSSAAGTYTVSATNPAGSQTSDPATLTVQVPVHLSPIFTNQPVSITVLEGTTATFTGQATGDEPLTYQWYVGSSAIEGATNQTLILTNVQSSAAGTYTVSATNLAGSQTSDPATLTVHGPGRLSVTVAEDGLELDASGLFTGATYVLESSDDFTTWYPLESIPAASASWHFVSPDVSTNQMRFYRLVAQ